MKELYQQLIIKVISFNNEDIITESGPDDEFED